MLQKEEENAANMFIYVKLIKYKNMICNFHVLKQCLHTSHKLCVHCVFVIYSIS